jgi:hypothetical protein
MEIQRKTEGTKNERRKKIKIGRKSREAEIETKERENEV